MSGHESKQNQNARKYYSESERLEAIKQSKTRYMTNTSWVCPSCGKDYKLNSKTQHLKTKKHQRNSNKTD